MGPSTPGNSAQGLREPSLKQLFPIIFLIGFLGNGLLVAFRRLFIVDMHLPFPSSTAVGEFDVCSRTLQDSSIRFKNTKNSTSALPLFWWYCKRFRKCTNRRQDSCARAYEKPSWLFNSQKTSPATGAPSKSFPIPFMMSCTAHKNLMLLDGVRLLCVDRRGQM